MRKSEYGLPKTDDNGKQKIPSDKEPGLLADIAGAAIRIGWIVLVIIVVFIFILGITVNKGENMSPAFHDGDTVVFYKLVDSFENKDIVVYSGEEGDLKLGRVVAKPGDVVDIDEKGLKVNGYYQEERYATGETLRYEGGPKYPLTLDENEYFVLADNREQGEDSRIYGAMSKGMIKGRSLISFRHRNW